MEEKKSVAEESKTTKSSVNIIAGIIAVIAVVFLIVSSFSGTSSKTHHGFDPSLTRDGLYWEVPPNSMVESWRSEGWQEVVSTPGAIIGVKSDGVYRLDSETGKTLWSYTREDSVVCDAASLDGQLGVVFRNNDDGCSDVIVLNAATGEHIRTAKYATEEKTAKLIGQASNILLLTPSHARLMRDDLVTKSEFGNNGYATNPSDQFVDNCIISDGAISGDGYAIAAQCDNNGSYSVYYMSKDPTESTQAESLLTIDTKSPLPVTIPVISKAMIAFVKQGEAPSVYVWELTKDQSEVSHNYIPVNSYGYEYQDIPGMGYVWRIGETVYVRYGSEDVSQFVQQSGAIGDPLIADTKLLVPQTGKILVWDTKTQETSDILIEGFTGVKFGFAGRTAVSFNDGVVTGYN